ncbi:MAG TPA: hypothetical protein VM915_00030 [Verrucomicrobiae bacterium]|nr:hypothetical protein [Verrucomicrobiae bacterium]
MMWMGKTSGIAALAMGALLIGVAVVGFNLELGIFAMMAIGALLLIGGFRTLRKMSGGLRLLSGAWGCATGYSLVPLAQAGDFASFFDDFGPLAYAMLAITLVSAACLALTVLHKEK